MKSIYRLILSIILTAAVIAILQQVSSPDGAAHPTFNPVVFAIVFLAIALASFISPLIQTGTASKKSSTPAPKKASKKTSKSGNREQGTVKWFNVSKGYGFVTRENGEEIFVHFRSILGEGRRVLREGDSIEFSVTQGDKGPQAEDVEPL
jgi:CspA family cold shock protein